MPRGYCWSLCSQRGIAELAFSLSPTAGACVRVWYDHPAPQALSPTQLSTVVRDHRGKSSVPVKWAVLPKCPSRPAWGGGLMEVRVAWAEEMAGGNVSVGRSAPQAVHSRTHSLTSTVTTETPKVGGCGKGRTRALKISAMIGPVWLPHCRVADASQAAGHSVVASSSTYSTNKRREPLLCLSIKPLIEKLQVARGVGTFVCSGIQTESKRLHVQEGMRSINSMVP